MLDDAVNRSSQLRNLIRSSDWMMRVLAAVRDIDVAYFDPYHLGRDRDEQATALLASIWPELPWEARNQAAVHCWYHRKFGGEPVPPLRSIPEAIGTWPETATAVAHSAGERLALTRLRPRQASDNRATNTVLTRKRWSHRVERRVATGSPGVVPARTGRPGAGNDR